MAPGILKFDSDCDNTKQSVKAAPGQITGFAFYNPNSSIAFIQLFDALAASVTVGTTAPSYVIPVPAEGAADGYPDGGMQFATGITYAVTTTPTGSTDPTTGLTGSFLYK